MPHVSNSTVIGVASTFKSLDSMVDFHTGRAPFFVVYDAEQESFKVINNMRCIECPHEAGVQSVNRLVEQDVKVMIVRNIGPNTFQRFLNAQIDVFYTEEIPVYKAIKLFRNGELSVARVHNCIGHLHQEQSSQRT